MAICRCMAAAIFRWGWLLSTSSALLRAAGRVNRSIVTTAAMRQAFLCIGCRGCRQRRLRYGNAGRLAQGHAVVDRQREHLLFAAAAGNQGHSPHRHQLSGGLRGQRIAEAGCGLREQQGQAAAGLFQLLRHRRWEGPVARCHA